LNRPRRSGMRLIEHKNQRRCQKHNRKDANDSLHVMGQPLATAITRSPRQAMLPTGCVPLAGSVFTRQATAALVIGMNHPTRIRLMAHVAVIRDRKTRLDIGLETR